MGFWKFLFIWGRRLPGLFSFVFALLMLIYLAVCSSVVKAVGVKDIADLVQPLLALVGLPNFGKMAIVGVFWEGLLVVLLLLLGVLLSYNVAAFIYRKLRRKRCRLEVPAPAPESPGRGTRLDGFEKIGIILAGGGAKGAYQAGSMKAIYEFLEANNALRKVRMIAGTSIGSWNAMFWLAGLVKPPKPDAPSVHEQWWRSVSLARIAEFASYFPLRRNYFVLATPWREMFRHIFVDTAEVRERLASLFAANGAKKDPPIHFYFTRSNVERGLLEFATNWPDLRSVTRPNFRTPDPNDVEPLVRCDRYELIDGDDPIASLTHTEQAVFASMDLPPLFPYMKIKVDVEKCFEDGGVVENVPVWFGTQLEQCDLLFILPLNASFAEAADETSVTRRIFRVMDVRQGVLERNALKLAYLYNELAALRNRAEQTAASAPGSGLPNAEARALSRRHKPISVFAICPQQPLSINTTEFWKPREAGQAFDLMYAATKCELEERFEEDSTPNWIRLTLVSPQGERSWVDDF